MLKKIYLTYIKKNNEVDEVYSGMASGNWDGYSGNQINGISPRNKKKNLYISAAIKLFGTISILLFLLHLVKR